MFKNLTQPDIFPFVGFWNLEVREIMRQEYPRKSLSFEVSDEELERDCAADFSKEDIWSLICVEAIDTEYSHIYYTRVYEEILRRGISEEELKQARKFMWLTAGWLNFKKMMWDWVNLDEKDIRLAIEIQREEKLIDNAKMARMNEYIDKIKEIDQRKFYGGHGRKVR